jgi:YHS domain-containing protein
MKLNPSRVFARSAAVLAVSALVATLNFGSATVAEAYDVNSPASINVDAKGVILRGFDATSYSADSKPVAGSSEYSAAAGGATYLFSSAAARDAFAANPEKYEPAFGGFCVVGAALNKKLDGDPEIFRILDGKLYLFVSQEAVEVWDKDPAGTLAKANANWPGISDKTPSSL